MSAFPLHQRLAALSVIKEMIRSASKEYYKRIFEENRNQIKPYAFSLFFKNFKIDGHQIQADELQMIISSPHVEFFMHLLNGSQNNKTYQYKEYTVILKRLELLKEKEIKKSIVVMKTLSPILIEDRDKKPLAPTSPYYEQELQYTAQLIVSSIQHRPLLRPILLKDTQLHKQVIKESFHQDLSQELFFTAYKGILVLEGHPEDLNCLYQSGLGKRTNIGFGLVEVMEEI
jgi:CRISPR-associated endoribonuclease Cas6